MKALLLAAGLGTRLKPITNDIPKCLVPINGKPLLQYWLENLYQVGVNEFLINTHYLHEKVESFVENSPFKNKIKLLYEEELLNTGGTILFNKNYFNKDESFMIVHADNLCFCDFKSFINKHKNDDYDLTMMLFKTKYPKSCGVVKLNDEGIVEEFHEKVENPPSSLANAAVYICNYNIFTFLESLNKKYIDFSLDVIPKYIGKINTYINNEYHIDIGTPETYLEAQNYNLKIRKVKLLSK